MIARIKDVIASLQRLELALQKHDALRRETATIRVAFATRLAAIKAIRRQKRAQVLPKPKPVPMIIELFIPHVEDEPGFSCKLNVNSFDGLRTWQWWRDIFNGVEV